jgi:hypothetical protein
MFEPYLKSFYIRSTDPTQIKILKVSDGGHAVWHPHPQPVSAAEPRAETAADVLLPGVLQGL